MSEQDRQQSTFEDRHLGGDEPLSLHQESAGPTVGERIRRGREAAGLSAADLAQPLNLDLKVIERIERDQLDDIPGRPYILAYLRSWAGQLGLDAEALIAQYNAQQAPDQASGQGGVHPTLDVMEPGGGYGLRLMSWLVILLLVVLAGVGLSQLDTERVQAWWSDLRGDPAPAKTLAAGSEGPDTSDTALVERRLEQPPPPPAESEAEPVAPTTAGLPEQRLAALDRRARDDGDSNPVAETVPTGPVTDTPVLVLRATRADSWIEVRDGKDERLMYDVLAAGEERSFSEVEGPFSLVLGHPEGMEVEYQGEPVVLNPSGDATGVLRTTVGGS